MEIQKIERHFEEEHESPKLRKIGYAMQKCSLCRDELGSGRQAGNGEGNIESPRLVFKHDKNHKSEDKRGNSVQESEPPTPPPAEQSLQPTSATEYKPTHPSDERGQEDHTRDRTPKALHCTAQDITSQKICAQGVTIPWGKKLITTVNFHRIVE
jgi:hypothetical protein